MEIKVGQNWSYKARPGDEGSTLTICKIENRDIGDVVHIYVYGVKADQNAEPQNIGHMPIMKDALKDSLIVLKSSDTNLPDYEEGYVIWKEAFDEGHAGCFSLPVEQAIQYIFGVIAQGEEVKE
jgi:hypothetical protein